MSDVSDDNEFEHNSDIPIPAWVIADATLYGDMYPDTFELPTEEEIAALRPRDLAKLIFLLTTPKPIDDKGTRVGGERMWVAINEVEGGRFKGTLDNDPGDIEDLHYGDEVEFGPEAIIQTQHTGTQD